MSGAKNAVMQHHTPEELTPIVRTVQLKKLELAAHELHI
jgi:hypothetical protein